MKLTQNYLEPNKRVIIKIFNFDKHIHVLKKGVQLGPHLPFY